MSWGAPTFSDTGVTTAARCSLPILESPIPGVNTPYILKEDWQQQLTGAWSPATIATSTGSTQHPEYSGFYLMEETPLQDMGGGWVKWTKIWAKVPSQHYEWETFAYNFIGIINITGVNIPIVQGRNRIALTVLSKVVYDYALSTTPYSDLPQIVSMPYVNQGAYGGTDYGGIYFPTDSLGTYTWPSWDDYKIMVGDALNNGWAASVTTPSVNTTTGIVSFTGGTKGGLIPAEDSRITRWRGNIWQRQTRYVQAR